MTNDPQEREPQDPYAPLDSNERYRFPLQSVEPAKDVPMWPLLVACGILFAVIVWAFAS